jgi:hypothetical protein
MMNPSPGVGGVYKVSLRMFENFLSPDDLAHLETHSFFT